MNVTAYLKKKLACLLVAALLLGIGLPAPGTLTGTAFADSPNIADIGSMPAPDDAAPLDPDAASGGDMQPAAASMPGISGTSDSPALLTAAPNPVANGSFEATDALGMPSGWAFARFSGSYAATVDTAVYADGLQSLRIQAAQTARVAAYQDVPVTGGQSVTLSQSIKLENIVSASLGVTIRVQYYNAAGSNLGSTFYGGWKGTQNWFRQGFVLQPPAAAVKARLEYFLWEASGSVWFDAIRLDEAPLAIEKIRNGGFEYHDGSGKPADWSFAKFSGTSEAAVSAADYREGLKSLRIHAAAPARVSAVQDITVTPGQYVKLSQWVKTEAVEGELGAVLRVQYYDSANTSLSTVYFDQWKGTNDWFLSTYFIRPPANAVKARLEFFLWNSSGTLWLDDVSAVSSKYPPPSVSKAVYRPNGQAQLFWNPGTVTGSGVTVSVYAHSAPLDDSNLPSAVLIQSGFPIAAGNAAFVIDPVAYPYVGIIVHHPSDGDSAVAGKRLEPYRVPVPLTFESVRGFDGNIVSAWKVSNEDSVLLTGATVSLYTSDVPVTEQNLAQARLLSSGIPAALASAESAPGGSSATDTYIGMVITDSQSTASVVIPAEIKSVPQILPKVDDQAPAVRSHPFLFYTSEALDNAKTKITTYTWASNALQQLKKRVDPLVSAPEVVYPTFGTGSRDASDPIIQFMTKTRDAGLLYQLTNEPQYAEYVKKVLLGLASSYLDLPYVDATRARWDFELLAEIRHMMHLMSAYDLIMPSGILNAEEQSLIKNRLFLTNYENSRRYIEIYPNMRYSNWVTWMDFSVGATGILLNRPDWVDFAVNHPVTGIKNNLLNNVNEDGFFLENSVAYLKFTTAAAIGFAEALYHSNLDLYHTPMSGIRERDGLSIQNKYPIREMLAALDYYRFSNNAVPPVGDSGIISYSPLISIMLNESELAYARYGLDPDLGKALAAAIGYDRSGMPRDAGFIYAEPLDAIAQGPFTIGTNDFANAGYNWLGSTVLEDTGAAFFRSSGGGNASNLNMYWDPYGAATGHYHSDKLSLNIHMLGQKAIQEAGSFAYDQTGPQIPWGRTTLAHNTIVVDETSQAPQAFAPWAMWAGDTASRSSAGEKKALGIGPLFKVIRAYNDTAYGGVLPIYGSTFSQTKLEDRLFDTKLDRTVAMIGDYVIDLFHASSPGQHQYDYPLHFPVPQQSGTYAGDTPLQPSSGPLGAKNGYDKVDSVSRAATDQDWTYTLALDDANVGIRMIGEPGTEIIKGSTIGNNSILIARRSGRQETHYASLFEPYTNASNIVQFAYTPVAGPVKGLKVERLDGGKDYLLVGQGTGVKSASETTLSTDGNVAFKRLDPAGAAAALAFTEGTNASAGTVSIGTDRQAGSLQWTKLGSGSARIDFMGDAGTVITIADVPSDRNVYVLDAEGQAVDQLAAVRSGSQVSFAAGSERQAFCICTAGSLVELPPADKVTVESDNPYANLPSAVLGEPGGDSPGSVKITVEAEQIAEQSGGSVTLTDKPGAQPAGTINSFRGWDNIGHTIRWNMHVDNPGQYMVRFRYAAALDQSYRTFRIDNSGDYNIYFPNTGGWNDWDLTGLHTPNGGYLLFTLTEGDHTITMTNSSLADGTGTNLDYIELVRIEDTPMSVAVMSGLIDRFAGLDELRGPLLPQLRNRLNQAEHHFGKGHNEQAEKHMNDFIASLQKGSMQQHISATAKAELLAGANALLAVWRD